jgi:hypothetical protein
MSSASFRFAAGFALCCVVPGFVHAQTAQPDAAALVTPALMKNIREWLDTEMVQLSVETQNKRYGKLSQEEIEKLDKQWVAERKSDDKPLIASTLSNPLSVYLSRMQGKSLGLFAEIFVMDDKGLNVGQSSITSDFWQGDEAKFEKTFPVASDAVFIDDPEWDKDAGIWRAQINFTLTAADGKKPIGAATVEVNLTELERRQALGI